MSNKFNAWVLRASLVGFIAGCRLLLEDVPHFDNLMKVRLHGAYDLFGLIYDVVIHDDLVMRQLILADVLEPELILDQRENRLALIELNVLTVGYRLGGRIIQGLPPQPPVHLDALIVCDEVELRAFTANLIYLRLIFKATQVPVDELIVVHLRQATAVDGAFEDNKVDPFGVMMTSSLTRFVH